MVESLANRLFCVKQLTKVQVRIRKFASQVVMALKNARFDLTRKITTCINTAIKTQI